MKLTTLLLIAFFAIVFLPSCKGPQDPNDEMAEILHSIYLQNEVPANIYSGTYQVHYYDSLNNLPGAEDNMYLKASRANAYVLYGDEKKALEIYQEILDKTPRDNVSHRRKLMHEMAIAWLRLGERSNCITNHTGESCIFPIQGGGIHTDMRGSENAIKIYQQLLDEIPDDLKAKWLLNVAYMTIGGYPDDVPKEYLMKTSDDTSYLIKPFVDAAMKTGLNVKNVSGTSITDDFNNDGYIDLITSSMSLIEGLNYFINNGDGTFSDASKVSGLSQLTGGLNISQTDFNNDGFRDLWVMRGGWKSEYGQEPNSLIQNNGDGTFTDVTKKSGLFNYYPSMVSNWADLNGDGWLDLVRGNEPVSKIQSPAQVFINNKDGTFTECAIACNINIADYVKGINTGDYNNDGLMDLYISAFSGNKHLFKNTGNNKNGQPVFEEVTKQAGITNTTGSFSTWFWDYDNDGHLDIINCLYKNSAPIAFYYASELLGEPAPIESQILLYRNKGDGTFEDVSIKTGLNKVFFSMGTNFGDIDNDGYLDFYICTGDPDFSNILPNKLYRNVNGKYFEDVTGSARVGSLQKAHGTSFSDIDNDGDLDLYIEQGGPTEGDAYQNALFINPGQNDNHWVNISFRGVKANAAAIGTKVKVTFRENNIERSIYREVNGGSSYGANALAQHIGIGSAAKIDKIEIKWPGSGTSQVFTELPIDKYWTITEGDNKLVERKLRKLDFLDPSRTIIGCAPLALKKN